MIEVNLFAVPAGDKDAMVGRLVARSRFDRETMGVSVMEFTKGFLQNNLELFEGQLGNADLVGLINSDQILSRQEILGCINYYLLQAGYYIKIWNVAEDEENAVTIPTGTGVEWNIVNHNFIQNDYPTCTKIMSDGQDIPTILKQIVEQSGLFNEARFGGAVNPFQILLNNLEHIKEISGQVNSNLTSKIYQILNDCHYHIFCATAENQ